jgi:hypothetical protein
VLTLADVIEALIGVRPQRADYEAAFITEADVDSRQVIPGALFVALQGERVDGHEYVAHAFSRGASFALVSRDLTARFPVLDLRAAPTSGRGWMGEVIGLPAGGVGGRGAGRTAGATRSCGTGRGEQTGSIKGR